MRAIFGIFILLTFTWLTGCAVNPVTGKTELSTISPQQEVAIGTQHYIPYQQQQGGRYTVDPDLGRYVNDIGQALARASDRPGLPYEFVVLNNDVPNAWALPGGKIAINRGLLVELEDEAQLAAVLGHEIVHVAGKHTVQKMQQSQLLGIGVLATAVLTRNSEYGTLATAGAGVGAGIWSAKYGRDQELQSDEVGMRYMATLGYDPYAAVELQQTFVKLSEQRASGGWLEGLFASHPPSQARVDRNKVIAAELGSGGKRNRDVFKRRITQIKKDQPAYEHHQKAMLAASEKDYDKAMSLVDKAINHQPDEALFHNTKGQIYLAKKMDSRAAKSFTKAASLNPDYFLGHLGLGLIEKKQRRYSQAKRSLLKSRQLLPTQSAVFHLGEIELSEGNKTEAIKYFQAAAQQGGDLGAKAEAHLKTLQPAPTNSP